MTAIRTASMMTRSFVGALLALVLALRLLSPAGFMPAFEHGAVTIVACPEAAAVPAMPHHHGGTPGQHQPCPYAAASATGAPVELAFFAALIIFAAALLIGCACLFEQNRRAHDWPPAVGPPLAS